MKSGINKNKRKLLIVTSSIGTGGTEKVALTIFNNINRDKFEVRLLVLCQYEIEKTDGTYFPNEIIALNKKKLRHTFFLQHQFINNYKPDVVLSFFDHVNIQLLIQRFLFGWKFPIVSRSSTLINIFLNSLPPIQRFLNQQLFSFFYPKTDILVCQSLVMKETFAASFNIPLRKLLVINNPVDEQRVVKLSNEITDFSYKQNVLKLIAVGNLRPEKGYDRLLEIIYKAKHLPLQLVIIGDGPEYDYVLSLIEKYKIQNKVQLLGTLKNPYNVMVKADFLVNTSHFEGYPNAMVEALVLKLPIIAYNAPGGISEIIRNNENGFLIAQNDCDSFVSILQAQCRNPLQIKGEDSVLNRHLLKNVIQHYEDILEAI